MESYSNNFLESLQHQIFLMKNLIPDDNSFKNQVKSIKKTIKEVGENLELIRRRSDFKLVMQELERMIEKIH